MNGEEEKIIRQVKTMLENATPFDMPPSRYNALETMVNLIEKQQGKIDKVKNQLKNQIEHCENENAELYDKCSINLKFNKGLLKLLEE